MVWVEIWEENRVNLLNRYNEKFDKVIQFLKENKGEFIEHFYLHEWTDPRVIVVTNTHRFVLSCTTNQLQKIKKVIE